jgi:hypothetical protein
LSEADKNFRVTGFRRFQAFLVRKSASAAMFDAFMRNGRRYRQSDARSILSAFIVILLFGFMKLALTVKTKA